ncbi:MAG: response regulator [Rhizobiaceae bacterium]|nr:response regulator [Rhizobiaceae bacterium]
MSSIVSRAYLRRRLLAILVGFVVALSAGTGVILWVAEQSKTNVKYAELIRYVADATSDVIYHSLRVDNTRILVLQNQPAASDSGSAVDAIHADLHAAIRELELGYEALRIAADDDVGMGESKQVSAEQGEEVLVGTDNAAYQKVRNLAMPEVVRTIWDGTEDGESLKRDIMEVLTHANRLDIFRDYSLPAAQRVFTQLQQLANERVRPNLAMTLERLNAQMVSNYNALQYMLAIVAISMAIACALVVLRIFEPMTRTIEEAQEGQHRAKEQVEAEKHRAESADRAKSEFLANMSHEIRTPMNGVLGMAELLSRTELDSRQNMFVDVIVKSGNALLTIINDILDFSKIDAGQMHLDPAPFLLGEAVEDVATLVSTRVAEKDLELIVRVDPTLPESVVGDVGRFRQITTNLVGNAVKFTERGHVLVDVSGKLLEDDNVEVTIRVEDTGVGIPEDKLSSVFEKFAQVDASSTRRHEGTGLGLAIATRLVELMGGRMGAESTVGKGSVFWFTVPMPIDHEMESRKPVPVDVTGARILAVDDNPINREIISEQLRSWGFDAAATDSGEMGLAFLERAAEIGTRVDCVILDYQMPGMNGADVARQIRANPATAAIPIVLLTSVDQIETGRLAAECGINAQLTKPARSSALLDTIVTTLQMARAVRQPSVAATSQVQTAIAAPALKPQPAIETPPAAAPKRAPAAAARAKRREALDVLVAEDNGVNQLVFGQILDGLDISYRIASNGRTAVELYRTLNPSIILMDVSMPEMNGLEATAAIRDLERASGIHTPIIGVTAHALKGDKERCLEAGMDDYLSKPVSPDRLAAKIEAWMRTEDVALTA